MVYLQQAHSSPILRKEKQQRSLSAQPWPFLSEQSLFLSSSNTTGALWPRSSGGPWLISLLSLPKPSRAAPHMTKSPTRCTFNSKNISVSMKRRGGSVIGVTAKTRPFGECSSLVECPDSSGTTLATGNLGDFLLAALFSEGWHEHRNPRKLLVLSVPAQGTLWSRQLKFG